MTLEGRLLHPNKDAINGEVIHTTPFLEMVETMVRGKEYPSNPPRTVYLDLTGFPLKNLTIDLRDYRSKFVDNPSLKDRYDFLKRGQIFFPEKRKRELMEFGRPLFLSMETKGAWSTGPIVISGTVRMNEDGEIVEAVTGNLIEGHSLFDRKFIAGYSHSHYREKPFSEGSDLYEILASCYDSIHKIRRRLSDERESVEFLLTPATTQLIFPTDETKSYLKGIEPSLFRDSLTQDLITPDALAFDVRIFQFANLYKFFVEQGVSVPDDLLDFIKWIDKNGQEFWGKYWLAMVVEKYHLAYYIDDDNTGEFRRNTEDKMQVFNDFIKRL